MKFKVVVLSLGLLLPLIPAIAATRPKSGAICSKVGVTQNYMGKKFTCIKSGKKLIWDKGVLIKKSLPTPSPSLTPTASPSSTPTPTASPSSTPTPTASPSSTPTPTSTPPAIPICFGIAKREQNKFKVSIQLLDPFDKTKTLNGGAIFLKVNSIWTYNPANINGRINVYIDPGRYEIDTLPPIRSEYFLTRKGFVLNMGSDGQFSISNSKLAENHCLISSELSNSGLARFSEVKSSNYRFAIEPIEVRSPTSTVKYIAPISNRQQNPIVLDLYPWESKHFALLTISNQHNPVVVGRLLRSLDLSFEIYDEVTSGFPKYTISTSPWSRMLNGKSVIAQIPDVEGADSSKIVSCGGNACTALSTLGMEVRWQVLESTLWMLENLDVYDHVLFYELGRTFWPQNSCSPKISLKNDWGNNYQTATGFANLMSKEIMKRLNLPFGPEETMSGDEHYRQVLAIEEIFSNSVNQNLFDIFDNKVTINGLEGNNIWASLMTHLGKNLGGFVFYKKFFSSCDRLPNSQSNLKTIQNWKTLAELAAGKNLDSIFIQRWRMP